MKDLTDIPALMAEIGQAARDAATDLACASAERKHAETECRDNGPYDSELHNFQSLSLRLGAYLVIVVVDIGHGIAVEPRATGEMGRMVHRFNRPFLRFRIFARPNLATH